MRSVDLGHGVFAFEPDGIRDRVGTARPRAAAVDRAERSRRSRCIAVTVRRRCAPAPRPGANPQGSRHADARYPGLTPPPPSRAAPWPRLIFLLAVLTVARLAVAALAPLSPDEAYYWVWSRALAGGYPDHPPMVALWIRLGTAIAGDGAFGVRLLAPLATALGSVLLVRAGDDFFPGRGAGLTAAVLLNATLLLGIGAVTMTPDTPLLLFWTALLWALGRLLVTRRGEWWLVAGAAAGLAMDSKYTALLLLPAIGAWLGVTPSQKDWLRRPWPWAALALAALLFAPVLVWNADHGWVSFAKQGARAADWNPRRGLQFVAELVGGQIGLATPLIALLFGAGMATAARRGRAGDPAWALLAMLSLLPVLVFVQHAVGDRVQANWPSVIYPSAAIAAAGLSAGWLRLLRPGVALGLVITLAVWVQAVASPFPLPARWDPTLMRLGGWDGLAAAVEADGADRKCRVRRRRQLRRCGDSCATAAGCPGARRRRALVAVRPAGRAGADRRAYRACCCAARGGEDAPDTADWAQITEVGRIARTRDGMTAEDFLLYRVVGRAGAVPVAVMPRP